MEKKVKEYLLSLGFLPNKCGYHYLYDIICDGLSGEELLPLKFVAYSRLAKKYNKSVDSIEKDVQNAIGSAWLVGDVDRLYGEFGETIDMKKGKPSNKHFILTAIESCRSV
ncbi:MAG: sporulation initiation factor Spo0A C-terminal domain-containing protein [Acidaminococcus sp.]|nr:sporulation initiation factor Spo0A C-terminal domain-containing protein [Acidaminococcus sp.]MDD7398306.1 sporulation initiation factor Spo0A C-terminal domain-containing protein [Bacillota bacterium]MDY4558920.1 sporulation initiation factor Spo0A C-terminal domain-containing protein [Eubacteriales bacterium]